MLLDLGAFPGGWSQVAAQILFADDASSQNSRIVAVDIDDMEAIPNVHFVQGDVNDTATWNKIYSLLAPNQAPESAVGSTHEPKRMFDVILSDMAPKFTGNKSIDKIRSQELHELSLRIALNRLKPNGSLVFKAFQGTSVLGTGQSTAEKSSENDKDAKQLLKRYFKQVHVFKPDASRKTSAEMYVIGRKFLANGK